MVLRALMLLMALACIPKSDAPVDSVNIIGVTLVTEHSYPNDAADSLPEDVLEALEAELGKRSLDIRPRADLKLLIQTRAEYFSQLSGRYRWVVHAELSLTEPDNLAGGIQRRIQIPVFVQFHHQRDAAVLQQASPALARELGDMLEDWIHSTESQP